MTADGGVTRIRLRVFAGERLSEYEVTHKILDSGEGTVGDLKALIRHTTDYGGPYPRFSFVTAGLETAEDSALLSLFDLHQGIDIEAFSPSALEEEKRTQQKQQQHLQYQYYRRQRQLEVQGVLAAGSKLRASDEDLHPDYDHNRDRDGFNQELRRHSTPDADASSESGADGHDTASAEGEKGKKKKNRGVLSIFRRNSDMGPRSWVRGLSSSSTSSSSSSSSTSTSTSSTSSTSSPLSPRGKSS